jgi:hypothetical protein
MGKRHVGEYLGEPQPWPKFWGDNQLISRVFPQPSFDGIGYDQSRIIH